MRDDRTMPPSVRPPRQERTRESWQRVLDTGLELLVAGGWDALTVSEVCRRCGISAPSLYARVDGRAGLFLAVYDYGIAQVRATQTSNAVPAEPLALDEAVAAAARGMLTTFQQHEGFLRAVILRASVDPELRVRGALESRWAIAQAMENVPGASPAVAAAGRMMFAECVLRIIYGDDFFTGAPEPAERFLARLTAVGAAIIRAGVSAGDAPAP
jgi:AcrR family transcriptional regulator